MGWGLFQGGPLLAVVMEDYQFDFFLLDEVEEFFGAGAELLLVVVGGAGFAVEGESALQDGGVNGQEDGSGIGKAEEDRLMAGSVARSSEDG